MQYKKHTTLLFLCFFLAFCAMLPPLSAQEEQQRRLLDYCRRIIEQDQHEKARKVLHEILATDGDNVEAHILLASAFEEEGKLEQAKDYLLRTLKIQQDTPEACHALIRVVGMAEGLEAAQALHKRETWNPACKKAATQGLAEASRHAERYDLFEKYVEDLLQDEPNNPHLQEMKMESQIFNGKPREAHETMVTLVRNVLSSDRPAEEKTKEIKRLQGHFSQTRAEAEKQIKQGGATLPRHPSGHSRPKSPNSRRKTIIKETGVRDRPAQPDHRPQDKSRQSRSHQKI